jgi:hypothetical protein
LKKSRFCKLLTVHSLILLLSGCSLISVEANTPPSDETSVSKHLPRKKSVGISDALPTKRPRSNCKKIDDISDKCDAN